jgi:hypothetical protein
VTSAYKYDLLSWPLPDYSESKNLHFEWEYPVGRFPYPSPPQTTNDRIIVKMALYTQNLYLLSSEGKSTLDLTGLEHNIFYTEGQHLNL